MIEMLELRKLNNKESEFKNELIEKDGVKYRLTKKGLVDYNSASLKANGVLEIWQNLERQLNNRAQHQL